MYGTDLNLVHMQDAIIVLRAASVERGPDGGGKGYVLQQSVRREVDVSNIASKASPGLIKLNISSMTWPPGALVARPICLRVCLR